MCVDQCWRQNHNRSKFHSLIIFHFSELLTVASGSLSPEPDESNLWTFCELVLSQWFIKMIQLPRMIHSWNKHRHFQWMMISIFFRLLLRYYTLFNLYTVWFLENCMIKKCMSLNHLYGAFWSLTVPVSMYYKHIENSVQYIHWIKFWMTYGRVNNDRIHF